MGTMVKGRWVEEDRIIEDGGFKRRPSVFGTSLASDLASAIRTEAGRYHLIASLSCPWSHCTIIARTLKGLEREVPLQIAGGPRVQGYPVNAGAAWTVPGSDHQIVHMHELYSLSDPNYSGRSTVPVLWDSVRQEIVSNESAQILRLFDAVPPSSDGLDFTLVPPGLTEQIDALNQRLYGDLSNAVYRAGLAQRQDLYEEAVDQVFAMLDDLEARLVAQRFLFGPVLSESDLRLLPTLLRFDSVYHGHFRCSRRRLADYPNLWAYARDLYAWHGIAATTDFQVIREGYYLNDGAGNPFGIVAVAPDTDWSVAHGREELSPAFLFARDGKPFEVDPLTLQRRGKG
ncbi:glutathione S-transferase family protein [Pelagibius sp. Alg239-R121]|uniref:glutathione S-transferase family protein n=1 Tax=Pelagibius sp. Alg239-R121 TaxID=2993448 RepID=UPI0024A6713F|nr:glutathione S-transferase C-terminal domain-containing protein [Pelagibius sp. Alg239-R121]